MFKKLLANLPFNPSLLEQVNFYYGRLRRETALRRLGFMMMALSLLVQLGAALYPAQRSLAASSNDILSGITNKNSILRAWDNNTGNIRSIYSKFGITRANISAIPGQSPNATIHSSARDYWSIGRHPLSAYGISGNKWGERTVHANGTIVYERPLQAWDTHGSSTYKAFRGTNQFGATFYILQTCGNPTFVGPYLPSPPKPKLTVHKTLLSSSVVHPGDTVKFRLEYRNAREDSLATNFKLTDTLNSHLDYVSLNDISSRSGNTLSLTRSGKLGYTDSPYVSTLVVRVKSSTPNATVICNQASVRSDQDTATSEKPCITVTVPTKPGVPPPTPAAYCIASSSYVSGSNKDFVVRTSAYVSGDTQITGYNYDVDGNNTIDYQDKTVATTYDKRINGLSPGQHTILVYPQFTAGGQGGQLSACQTQISIAPDARVNLSKSVYNTTKNNDANSTTVQSGDILEFKLTTKNVTATAYKNYNGKDYFGSVLQYADIVDANELSHQGLILDKQGYIHWTIPSLSGNTTDVKTIRVKVKDVTPVTNTPSTVSPDYSCKISNDYGNEVTMNVDCPLVKSIDVAATTLPNTGPGTSLTVGVVAAIVVGYLFARSRLMARELEIVRNEHIDLGGF